MIIFIGGSYEIAGNLMVILNPYEWLFLILLTIITFVMSNPLDIIQYFIKHCYKITKNKPYNIDDYLNILGFLFIFFKKSNTANMIEIEKYIDNPLDHALFNRTKVLVDNKDVLDFFCNSFRIIVLGFDDAEAMENIMYNAINGKKKQQDSLCKALYKLADALPALGIVAAVLGVIGAMSVAGGEAEILGAKVASAMVGTFAGVFLSYCIIGPITNSLEAFFNAELDFLKTLKTAIISYSQGYPPSIIIEITRQSIPESHKPSFENVEDKIYNTTENLDT
jgi:chemotaxis protein MotA